MITGNNKLSNDGFLLLIIHFVLVVILFYTYFPLNGAIKEMHNNGQGITPLIQKESGTLILKHFDCEYLDKNAGI